MFKKIKVSNFHSIGEEQIFSMEINSKDILDDSAIEFKSTSLNLLSCIIGANASGKTTILKAISFIFWFVNSAYTSFKNEYGIPVIQHRLMQNQPTKIELEFYNNGLMYIYKIEFNTTKILRESLEKEGLRHSVFELDRTSKTVEIKAHSSLKINETDNIRFKDRQNVPLLSSLIDTAYLSDISFFKNFTSNVNQFGTVIEGLDILKLSHELQGNLEMQRKLLNFSKDLDLGISSLQFGKVKAWNANSLNDVPILELIHRSGDKEFTLPLFAESNGAQHSISLYMKILPILQKGGIVELDEIDYGLHIDVVKKIISLFENKETNPHNAQLIFSTHQLPLLNDRTKTQIFITEKNKSLETEIFRLDELEGIRNDENYFHKYMAGSYGGTPDINWLGVKNK